MGKRFYAKESTDIKMTMILPTAFVFLWALPCHFQSLFRILVIDFKAAVCKFAHIDLSGQFLFETSLCLLPRKRCLKQLPPAPFPASFKNTSIARYYSRSFSKPRPRCLVCESAQVHCSRCLVLKLHFSRCSTLKCSSTSSCVLSCQFQ